MSATFTAPTASLSLNQQQIDELVQEQQLFFNSGITRSYQFRKAQLGVLKAAIKRFEKDLLQAMHSDLRKNDFEGYSTEVGVVLHEISHAQKNLRQWMQTQKVPTPTLFFPGNSKIINDPLGAVLIISPWNYPVQMLLSPLVAAIAGGNTAILKPSELAPATEKVLATLIEETFEPEYIACLTGLGHHIGPQLIERHHLDLIFFTGSTRVGRIIMQHAARQLTPVILELGGKSPCIVDETANITWAAKKIAFGKFINAGQTCVAPDYVLVHEKVKDKLVAALKKQLTAMYGTNPQQMPDYSRIINQGRFNTLAGYLEAGVKILAGGAMDEADLFIAPTVVETESDDHPLWHEEIFGPILPIKTYSQTEELFQIIGINPYPLAFYLFSSNSEMEKLLTERVRFGGGCINNTLVHLGNPNLPFGGVGYSGMGQYHGYEGYRSFTRPKSIFTSPTFGDTPLWYPPVKDWYIKVIRMLMK